MTTHPPSPAADVTGFDAATFTGTAEVAKAFEFCRKDSDTGIVEVETR